MTPGMNTTNWLKSLLIRLFGSRDVAAGVRLVDTAETAQFILKTDGIILPDGKIKIDMDWNPEFINNARQSGCGGLTDHETVEQFLGVILCSILGITAEEQYELAEDTKTKVVK